MADLHCTPSTLEVDYDKNLTALYKSITDQDWSRSINFCQKYPEQAATWVVRHYEDDEDSTKEDNKEIMWRFLPLHSACARQPPASVISALIRAYPDAAKCVDDQGMYALHYACGNQATRDVIRLLLVSFPEASTIADPRGMLPIHYVACWGPSTVSVVDMLLVTNSRVGVALDGDGNTALDLALEGEYNEKDAVVATLKKWLRKDEVASAASSNQNTYSSNPLRHAASAGSTGAVGNNKVSQNAARSSVNSTHADTSSNAYSNNVSNNNNKRDGHNNTNEGNSNRRSVIDSIISSTRNTSLIDAESVSTMGSHKSQSRSGHSVASKSVNKSRKAISPVEEEKKEEECDDDVNSNRNDNSDTKFTFDDNTGIDNESGRQSRSSETARSQGRQSRSSETARSQTEASVDTLKRVENELQNLQGDMEIKERGWKEKNNELESTWSEKFSKLEETAKRDAVELVMTKRELRENKEELQTKNTKLSKLEKEFGEIKAKLVESTEERRGLQVTLGDLMEQHETFERRSGNMNDRLGSLSVSLVSMMEQQNMLTNAMKNRNTKAKSTFDDRKKRLQDMLDMEESMENDETNLENALKKQNKEMEAIAAVIAAARD
jgi:hypothetical protein